MYLASPPSLWRAFLKGFSGNITHKRKWLFNNYAKKFHLFLRILFCMKSYYSSRCSSSHMWTLFMHDFLNIIFLVVDAKTITSRNCVNELHNLWACWLNYTGCYVVLPKWWNQGLRIGMMEKRLGRWPNNYILIKEDYKRQ